MRRAGVVLLTAALSTTALAAAAKPARLHFGAPVRLTVFDQCGGYEPGVLVDRFGNIVVTAHKQNHCDAAAVDPQGEDVPVRGMSWLWTSSDGRHFHDMPGTSVAGVDAADRMDIGDEGHLARDDRGNIYFADLKLADDTLVAWKATGRGRITQTVHQPVLVSGQPVDDRPWVAAHGNGVVLFASNGGTTTYQSPQSTGQSGRYTLYMSYDGGQTFDHLGVTIPSSGWCYPAADHRPGSKLLYVACTDDSHTLFAYVSRDDGHSWTVHRIGRFASLDGWPVAAVAPDGTVYVLHLDRQRPGTGAWHLDLYRSTDAGRSWDRWDATPQQGDFDDIAGAAWLDVAPDGSLGLTYYLRPPQDKNWHVYAAVATGWKEHWRIADASGAAVPGSPADGSPWGDFLSCAFGPDSRLHVVWTTPSGIGTNAVAGLNSDIYYAQQLR